MAHESHALSSNPAAAAKNEPPSTAELSRRSEQRIPNARETMATLPDVEADHDFEPHDTIPAPTWLEDESSPLHQAPSSGTP